MPVDHRRLRPKPAVGVAPPPVETFRILAESGSTLTTQGNAPLRTE